MRDTKWLGAMGLVQARRGLGFDGFARGGNMPALQPVDDVAPSWDADSWFRASATGPAPQALTGYSLTPSSTTVTEGNTSITFTITRSGDKPAQTVYASTLFDTARSPGDYDGLVNLAVSFSLNQTSKTFTVSINEDSLVESTEHFRVMIGDDTSDGSAQALDISDVYITDDDAPVGTQYSLTPSSTTVTEGNTSITFTVTRTGNTSSSATIYASTLFDTASSPGDYDGLVNRVVSFAANDATETFTVSINEDSLVESTEHFRVMIGDDTSDGSAQALDISDVYITDDDAPATAQYSLTPASTSVTEANTSITFTITRSGAFPPETLYASTLFDTASSPTDYDGLVNLAISFISGQVSKTFTVDINEDSLVEASEHFRVMIGHNPGDQSAQALDISDITILDNDAATTDTVREGTDTTRSLNLGDATSGTIDAEPISGDGVTSDQQGGFVDKDWFRVTLDRGHVYTFSGTSLSIGTGQVAISLHGANGTEVRSYVEGGSPSFTFDTTGQASASQDYYLAVSAGGPEPAWRTTTGNYAVAYSDTGGPPPPPPPPPASPDDYRDSDVDSTAPLGSLNPGGFATGTIGAPDSDDRYGDKDVFALTLAVGQLYDFRLRTSSADGPALPSGVFSIRDDDFDQLELSGSGSDVHEYFRADHGGTYYVRVGSGGSPSDRGGYRLDVTQVQPSQVPDDWADTPTDAGSTRSVNPGSSATGIIETAGDKDYFTVELLAGKIYHFSVQSEDRSGSGAMSTVALSLRGPNDFDASRASDGGSGEAGFSFSITQAGTYYVRVGAGDYSGDTGGYRVSVGNARTPPPPPPPIPPVGPGESPLQELSQFLDAIGSDGLTAALEYFGRDEFWASLRIMLKKVGQADALGASNIVFNHIGELASKTSHYLHVVDVVSEISRGGDPFQAILVEVADWFFGEALVQAGFRYGVPAAFLAGGVFGGIGAVLLLGGGIVFYETVGADYVENKIDLWYDGIDNYPAGSGFGRASLGVIMGKNSVEEDIPTLPRFDEEFYLNSYLDVETAIAQGTVGNALAHFLTIGIDLGYRPNASQSLSRSDLAFAIVNNDPSVLGNGALFTHPLGHLAGDGVSTSENTVANTLVAAAGPAFGATLDAGLSALAHRKALDLAVNMPGDTIAAAAAADSSWALQWSDGSDFGQVFTAELEALVGAGAPATSYRVFVTASATGSAADVLARFQPQQGWSSGGFDTFGIAEFGGHWVLIVADRSVGVAAVTPSADTLVTASIYGWGADETLYAGGRSGRLFGLDGNDALVGGPQNDLLNGGAGIDNMAGGPGDDSYFVDNAADWIVEGANEGSADRVFASVSYGLAQGVYVEILSTDSDTGTAPIALAGNELNNVIRGNAGDNALYGMGGVDQLTGLGGNDIYVVDNAGDTIIEVAGEGRDVVYASVNYALAAGSYVEVLTTSSQAATTPLDLTGNELANEIYGNAGANRLDGGGGADYLAGLGGNDIYYVDNEGVVVAEAAGEGRDVVYARAGYVLTAGSHVEVLSAISSAATTALFLIGNELSNEIYGNAGANHLDGGAGADYMAAFAGNDVYVVDNAGDVAAEAAGEGRDVVYARASYILTAGTSIEILSTADQAATTAIDLTGNELANEIYGNAGNNRLDGGAGADYMAGLAGNDIYIVDNEYDVAAEAAGQGRDVVYARLSYALTAGSHIEVLSAASQAATNAIDLFGNELANELYGNAGANYLDGGGGADYMAAFAGDDIYLVDHAGDAVAEAAGQGRDVVYAKVSYILAAGSSIEVLSTNLQAGTAAIDLTGNELANEVYGNNGANQLNGGAGGDYLLGFGGADSFAFTTGLGGGNVDIIGDFSAVDDTILLENAVFTGLAAGALAAGAFVIGTAAADADDRIIYDSATGRLFFDADGNGAGVAVHFATLATHPALTASDFMVI
ncbi:MAG: hypothetical protein QOG13_151 [Sphingomonadales bacterium]|nr:hypothetical protein [Sphingomonadales bacterium]